MDLGHWVFEGIVPEYFYGFVYIIVNNTNNRKYIGKKQCVTTVKLRPLKGKKNKRHVVKETDWRSYCGSSEQLLKDIEILGKDNFTFNINRFCDSKSELAYCEAKMQFDNDVLLREDYYNGIINVRIGKIAKKVIRS
jgi:hypothetical protein